VSFKVTVNVAVLVPFATKELAELVMLDKAALATRTTSVTLIKSYPAKLVATIPKLVWGMNVVGVPEITPVLVLKLRPVSVKTLLRMLLGRVYWVTAAPVLPAGEKLFADPLVKVRVLDPSA
jgi:hypothetical protein